MNGPFGKICGEENGSKNTRIFPFWFLPLKNYTCLHFALFLMSRILNVVPSNISFLPRDDI